MQEMDLFPNFWSLEGKWNENAWEVHDFIRNTNLPRFSLLRRSSSESFLYHFPSSWKKVGVDFMIFSEQFQNMYAYIAQQSQQNINDVLKVEIIYLKIIPSVALISW